MMKSAICFLVLLSAFHAEAIDKLKPFKTVQDFAVCGETHPVADCLKFLNAWLVKHNDDAAEAAKIVRKNASAELAVPYYRLGFRQRKVKCADSDVLETVTAGLQSKPGTTIVKDARSIAFTTCWNEWKGDLLAQFEAASSDFLKNVCPVLLEKKALSSEQMLKCREQVK